MDKNLRNVFDKIRAEDALKEKTASYLCSEIQRRKPAKRSPLRLAAVCVSLVLFLLAGGTSYYLYFTPSAFVDIDVNPSIELTLNRFGYVIEANSYNDDGTALLNEVDVRFSAYEEAVKKLIDSMDGKGYLRQNGLISVTVQGNSSSDEADMITGLKAVCSTMPPLIRYNMTADVFTVSLDVKAHSSEKHVSPAKFVAIEDLQAVDPTVSFEECRGHSISELQQMTKEHGGGNHGGNAATHDENQEGTDAGRSGNASSPSHHGDDNGHND